MKKLFLAIAAVAMVFATSCQKENVNEPALSAEDNEFICVIDQNASQQNAPAVNDNKGTLAHIDGSNNVWWQVGDEIAYYGTENTDGVGRYVLTCSKLSDNSAYFSAEGKHFGQGTHEAYYPASIMTLNGTQKVLKLPSTITLEANKNAAQLPMYGTNTEGKGGQHYLTFHNLCAVMKITIPSSLNGSSCFKLSSNKALNGAFTITNNTAVMSATPTSAEKKITVRKSSGNFATNEVVYVAVPAQHYDSLTIEFFNGSGISVVTKVVTNKTLAVSKVYPITVNATMTHQYVDLGLSVKWATCNIGGSSYTDVGSFFSWGKTTIYDNTTAYWNGSSYTKYNSTDNITVLEPGDDAAHILWGGNWRMPTAKECQELLDNCNQEFYETSYGSLVYLVKFTSKKNGNYIEMRMTGHYWNNTRYDQYSNGRYWTSTLCSTDKGSAMFLDISNASRHISNAGYRAYGFVIRPVCP